MLFDGRLGNEQLARHPPNRCRLGKRVVGDQWPAQHHEHVEFASGQPRGELKWLGRLGFLVTRCLPSVPYLPEDQPCLADAHLVSGTQDAFGGDPFPIEISAVATPQIPYRPRKSEVLEDGMQPRNGLVVLERHHIG